MRDQLNQAKFDRLKGDNVDNVTLERDSIHNTIKQYEEELEANEELIEHEKNNLEGIRNTKEGARNKLEDMGVLAIIKSDVSLKDKIKAITKLKGFKIGTIITIIGLVFSSIGLAISNAFKGRANPPGPNPPSPDPPRPPNTQDKIKEGLEKFGEWLKELAKKGGAALPGVIGSIVSLILKSAGELVFFAAQHVILLIIAIVGTIVFGLVEGVFNFKKESVIKRYHPPLTISKKLPKIDSTSKEKNKG